MQGTRNQERNFKYTVRGVRPYFTRQNGRGQQNQKVWSTTIVLTTIL